MNHKLFYTSGYDISEVISKEYGEDISQDILGK